MTSTENRNNANRLRVRRPAIYCPDCGKSNELKPLLSLAFSSTQVVPCRWCKKEFDLWEYALNLLKPQAPLFRNKGAAFLGSQEATFTFQLPPNGVTEVDLTEYGVPTGSKLLYVVYTPYSGAGWPLEIRGNQPLQHKQSLQMAFFGRAFPDSSAAPSDQHDVDMFVTYVPQLTGQLPFDQLATAFEYFLSDQFEKLILPCATALEYAVERTVIESLKTLKLPERGTSKRYAIEVLIPLICKLHGVPLIDQRVLNVLNELWTRRNEMAHEGKLKRAIDTSEAAKLLAASMFYMNYLVFFRERLGLT